MKRLLLSTVGYALITSFGAGPGHAADGEPDGLMNLSLEELMQVEVTSVSKRPQSLADTASAVYVLTSDDIRRSGATSVPEALRLVPGVNVARIDGNKWAISVRGFQAYSANKLLVLVDGRSIYSPLFSGVFWNLHDFVLDDIDRIEVVRGPGGSIWGANAVNGVINIITKSAKETQGSLVSGVMGSADRMIAEWRYGGTTGDDTSWRVFGKARRIDEQGALTGTVANDDWADGRAGFRVDADPDGPDEFLVEGEIVQQNLSENQVRGFVDTITPSEGHFTAGHLLGRWVRNDESGNSLSVQGYYDMARFENFFIPDITARVDTFDIEVNRSQDWGGRNNLIWGGGYRLNIRNSDQSNPDAIYFSRARNTDIISAFMQNETDLIPDRLTLTLGTKVEHNDFSGLEVQPTARVLGRPHPDHTVWAAVSRAVRTPSPADTDIAGQIRLERPAGLVPLPNQIMVQGDPDNEPERVIAYEAGYRAQVHPTTSVDTTIFYNVYEDLIGQTISSVGFDALPPNRLITDVVRVNNLEAESFGGEVALEIRPADWARLRIGFSHVSVNARTTDGTPDEVALVDLVGASAPSNQGFLHGSFDLPQDVTLDGVVRGTDDIGFGSIDAYVDLDLRVGWQPRDGVELSVVGQNLLNGNRQEFQSDTRSAVGTRVERAVFGRVTLRF